MKLISFLIYLSLVLIGHEGCSVFKSAGCAVQDGVVSAASGAVATAMVCSNQDAIKTDVDKLLGKYSLCVKDQTPKIISLCPLIAGSVVDLAFSAGVPKSWGCTGGMARDLVKQAVETACNKVL